MLSLNQPSQNTPNLKKLHIWVFHDARPGHLSQLEGFVQRLSFYVDIEIHWFDIAQNKLSFQHLSFLPDFLNEKNPPDLVLGAGHSTHQSVLIAGFLFKTFTTIIMKPSLPSFFFNAVICPKHDKLNDSKRVLSTFGPINKIDKTQLDSAVQDKTINLILIGGLSKHYHFDIAHIIEQIKTICFEHPSEHWLLSNSPRTPLDMNEALTDLNLTNLTVYDYKYGALDSIQNILLKTKFTWVTPDSMSMIFEALTAEASVGLINCKPKADTRIVKQITHLIEHGYVTTFEQRLIAAPLKHTISWEADRAALWLLQKLQSKRTVKKSGEHES